MKEMVLVALALIAGCKKKTEILKAGAACGSSRWQQCDDLAGETCSRGVCTAAAAVQGEVEAADRAIKAKAKAEAEATARAEAAAERQKEKDLLAASGIAPTAEAPVAEGSGSAAPPAPNAVRTVTTSAKTSAFAQCQVTERLIGGGCKSEGPLVESYPSGGTPADSIGARWTCTSTMLVGAPTTAYALCQKL